MTNTPVRVLLLWPTDWSLLDRYRAWALGLYANTSRCNAA